MVMTAPLSVVFHCIVIQQKHVSFYFDKVFLEFIQVLKFTLDQVFHFSMLLNALFSRLVLNLFLWLIIADWWSNPLVIRIDQLNLRVRNSWFYEKIRESLWLRINIFLTCPKILSFILVLELLIIVFKLIFNGWLYLIDWPVFEYLFVFLIFDKSIKLILLYLRVYDCWPLELLGNLDWLYWDLGFIFTHSPLFKKHSGVSICFVTVTKNSILYSLCSHAVQQRVFLVIQVLYILFPVLKFYFFLV